MRPIARPILAAALALAATAALAQATTGGQAAQPRGFFSSQPQSDPSLFRTLPPEAYESSPPKQEAAGQPAASRSPAAASNAEATRPLVVVVPEAANATPEQLDRAQLEAQQAQMNRAPAPINGAFTGNTDPNNR